MAFVAPVPHRSMLPPARTPRLAAVKFPAAVWVTAPPDCRRMVPVGPALSGVLMVRVPAAWQRVMSAPAPPPLLLLAPRKQADGPRTTKVNGPAELWTMVPPACSATLAAVSALTRLMLLSARTPSVLA